MQHRRIEMLPFAELKRRNVYKVSGNYAVVDRRMNGA